jgi:hypothetical protein
MRMCGSKLILCSRNQNVKITKFTKRKQNQGRGAGLGVTQIVYSYNLLQLHGDGFQPVKMNFEYDDEYLYHWNYIGRFALVILTEMQTI